MSLSARAIHPLSEADKRYLLVDGLLHGLVEQDPPQTVRKFIKYNLPARAISGSIKQSFDTLRGTFDTNQKFIANTLHIEQNLEYLPKIAGNLERAVKLAEGQRDEAIKEARKDRKRFYVGVVIGVVGIVVGAVIGIIALLR